ncbi:DEAD/DEAH box helicase [Mucilaginibacter xinganensis]|uniref:Superfamily II DNA or RNA helicase, SNF2 family n=1 Tax=Mucilaginibacter xinganensis TaxID=1234841 RepID=A0A223NZ33_9SPHI|nr:DEAD/DEAH box helicase [Mucilaginibacter xinganensis]ASU35149.1 Superfamily II DNA or RNA helicase, SNF2 family [Mucilaginibacter xinganensis]
MSKLRRDKDNTSGDHAVIFEGVTIAVLTETVISKHSIAGIYTDQVDSRHIFPVELAINKGVFTNKYLKTAYPDVTVTQESGQLNLVCECSDKGELLCEHQAAILSAIVKRDELRVFFDESLRYEKLKKIAVDYGMEREASLDRFFKIEYANGQLNISPFSNSLTAVTKEALGLLTTIVVPAIVPLDIEESTVVVVLKEHKYYKYLFVELYKAGMSKEGKIKNPLTAVPPLDFIWTTEDPKQLKFFTGIHKFQNHLNKIASDADILALRAIVNNPMEYDFYYHDSTISENVTAGSIMPVKVGLLNGDVKLAVEPREPFFELSGTLVINDKIYEVKDLRLKFTYFIFNGEDLYLVNNLQQLNIISLLTKKQDNLLVHTSKFDEFRKQLLVKLEDKVAVNYKHIPLATPLQLKQQGFNNETERIIYLSDFGAHVMIIPVMRYGEVEISVRTKKQIYSVDNGGKQFLVKRNDDDEINFTALLVKQHPFFEEQLDNDLDYFYLHKKRFLDEDWFLNVFDEWHNKKITVLGFNELEGNKLNPHKVKINIKVLSGFNWFNVAVNVQFGKKRAALKQIYRAVKNKTKYVQLDDGTTGILPAEWIEKFTGYFNSGEVTDQILQIAKTNFMAIDQLFDAAMLDEKVKDEISVYHQKLDNFDNIKPVAVPVGFIGSLRHYQQQGLGWLNFLDDFNFGGCLADDMGLGKTVQVIAFILSQRARVKQNTNLVVVPTSLIHNWQQEIQKFAPSVAIHTIYGSGRIKSIADFDNYEIVLTSYGTLLSDVVFLKDYAFNYIFLDESQQIKNPESQRYKAARLLKSRNKVVLTGTPVENNTYDLYGQLSFACPGLLGSKLYFKQIYSSPIDMFKSSRRATELQNKISPFILRRTKKQVAPDLPEKTEMVLYCEMKPEQRNIYDAYEKEFRDYISATTDDILKKTPMNVLKGLTRLRQICDSPLLIEGEKVPGNASAKIDALMEEIEGKMPQHKILVFSQFVSMLNLIKKELLGRGITFTCLTGQTRNRRAVIEEFQNNPGIKVFLISLKAGGTGLNLTEADYVYLVDPWWNPAVENQAIDRCHRIGQDKNIVAVRLICPSTVEEKIQLMQESKRDLANSLVKTDTSFINSFSKTELLNLLN